MWRKALKRILITLACLVTAVFIINAILVWRSSTALKKRLQAIQAAGQPLTLDGLRGDPISPQENASVYYRAAQKDIRAIERDLEELYKTDRWPDGPLTAEDVRTAEQILAAYPEVKSLIDKGSLCSQYRSEIQYGPAFSDFMSNSLEQMGYPRSIARYLTARCIVETARGRRDDALRTCVQILQLARAASNEPSLLGCLISIALQGSGADSANRVLRSGPVSDAARADLEAELAQHDPVEVYRHALITERTVGLAALRTRFPWPRFVWNKAAVAYLDLMDGELAQASRPYFMVSQANKPAARRPRTPWGAMALMSQPALQAARDAFAQSRAALGCLHIVNSITVLEQQGKVVTDLRDLRLSDEKVTDPFSGQPLLVKKSASGWLVYSVGSDRIDDGGQLEKRNDIGLGPTSPVPAIEQ